MTKQKFDQAVAAPRSPVELEPGETAMNSGIYIVTHDRLDGHDHAHPHPVIVMRGAVLPPCRLCRNGVRYSLMLAAEDVNTDGLLKWSPDA